MLWFDKEESLLLTILINLLSCNQKYINILMWTMHLPILSNKLFNSAVKKKHIVFVLYSK